MLGQCLAWQADFISDDKGRQVNPTPGMVARLRLEQAPAALDRDDEKLAGQVFRQKSRDPIVVALYLRKVSAKGPHYLVAHGGIFIMAEEAAKGTCAVAVVGGDVNRAASGVADNRQAWTNLGRPGRDRPQALLGRVPGRLRVFGHHVRYLG
ncbi:MAG: hypothetical protein N2512_08855 [Armatimonadetes bacterium]|nr:hypothetical protein [Armatimonadota bacterium]